MLWNIYGGKKIEKRWVHTTKQELRELYGEPKIINIIKAQPIRWLGHLFANEKQYN